MGSPGIDEPNQSFLTSCATVALTYKRNTDFLRQGQVSAMLPRRSFPAALKQCAASLMLFYK